MKIKNSLFALATAASCLIAPVAHGNSPKSTVEYHYDAVGNIVAIDIAGALQLHSFAPKTGPVGTRVVVKGSGFDANPTANTVRIGDTAAQVITATRQQIEFDVPQGATSGEITITSRGQTIGTGEPFTVVEPAAPEIIDFSPKIGAAGTAVAVTGKNFYATQTALTARLGIASAQLTPGSDTSLSLAVPTGTGTGRIAVTTAQGTATSAGYFFVPPAPYTAAQVNSAGALTIGAPQQVTISQPGAIAMYAFDVQAPSAVGVTATASTLSNGSLMLISPSGNIISSGNITTSGGVLSTVSLSQSGTHTLVEAAGSGVNGGVTLIAGAPDLVVSDLSIGTIVPQPDGRFSIPTTYTITNQGTVNAPASWYDMLFLSSTGMLDSSSLPLDGVYRRHSSLAPGESYTITTNFIAASSVTHGNYTLHFKTDANSPSYNGGSHTDGGSLREANETNNQRSMAVTLARPDLTIADVTLGTIIARADGRYSIPITYTVTNAGTVAAMPSWYDMGFLSSNGQLDDASVRLDGEYRRQSSLAPGESYTITTNFIAASNVTPGNYTLHFKTDANSPSYNGGSHTDGGSLREANETNNQRSMAVTLARP
ncbi:MAG TPA: CARDB domain-containing protein, partial [Vicinamibacterales bacterium]|nr:CARDB domain-containing protein [Vicinamibacterales bacterium]